MTNRENMEPKRSWIREPFSGLSHLAGAVLSVVALIVLLVLAHGRLRETVGCAVYGGSLILLYTSSALYHSLHLDEQKVRWLQRCDYMAIFLLIAGTYTPVCLVALRGPIGLELLAAVYSIAFMGIGIILFWRRAPHWVRVTLYIVMGWLAVIALPPLRAVLTHAALAWLIAGGVVYTLGTVVYATGRPRLWPGKFGSHDLWHLFVLGGSACHLILIVGLIARP